MTKIPNTFLLNLRLCKGWSLDTSQLVKLFLRPTHLLHKWTLTRFFCWKVFYRRNLLRVSVTHLTEYCDFTGGQGAIWLEVRIWRKKWQKKEVICCYEVAGYRTWTWRLQWWNVTKNIYSCTCLKYKLKDICTLPEYFHYTYPPLHLSQK